MANENIKYRIVKRTHPNQKGSRYIIQKRRRFLWWTWYADLYSWGDSAFFRYDTYSKARENLNILLNRRKKAIDVVVLDNPKLEDQEEG